MKQKSVWVLETTGYEGRVETIFSSKKAAKDYQSLVKHDEGDYAIREWQLDPLINEVGEDWRVFQVIMLRDGTVEAIHECNAYLYLWTEVAKCFVWERTKADAYKGRGIPDALSCDVWARNKDHAIKIARRLLKEKIDSGEWK